MGSILGWVIPKTTKMLPFASLLGAQHQHNWTWGGGLDHRMIPEHGATVRVQMVACLFMWPCDKLEQKSAVISSSITCDPECRRGGNRKWNKCKGMRYTGYSEKKCNEETTEGLKKRCRDVTIKKTYFVRISLEDEKTQRSWNVCWAVGKNKRK